MALIDIRKNAAYSTFSPVYDSLNCEAIFKDAGACVNEMALSFFEDDYDTDTYLNDGHSSSETFIELYKRLGMTEKMFLKHMKSIATKHEIVLAMVENSLLPEKETGHYLEVIEDRYRKLKK
ncbi:MAG: hypothetical protein MK132_14790 [Lentisphaerales bacterium]|nr:hypothetical protein [Lentisphaerales bacterium]